MKILVDCDVKVFCALAQTCKYFSSIIDEPKLWRQVGDHASARCSIPDPRSPPSRLSVRGEAAASARTVEHII